MPMQIPGYYFDPEKKKYFKIEKNHTAPSSAAWSTDAVKRRKTQDQISKAARKRTHETRRNVQRCPYFENPLYGVLERELSGPHGPRARDVRAGVWAGGLGVARKTTFGRERGDGAGVESFCVAGPAGKRVLYASTLETELAGVHVDGRPQARLRREQVPTPGVSKVRYHEASGRMLVAPAMGMDQCSLTTFAPSRDARGSWLPGETPSYQQLSMRHRVLSEWCTSALMPSSLDGTLAFLGTNQGVVQVSVQDSMRILSGKEGEQGSPKDVYTLDAQKEQPNIVFAGGRKAKLWMTDLRGGGWQGIRMPSAVAKVRSLNEHQVLVSGLQSTLAVYDLRFRRRDWPLVRMEDFRNEVHLDVGMDVSTELGVVAASHGAGIGLYSLDSGKKVKCPALDSVTLRAKEIAFYGDELWLGMGMAVRCYAYSSSPGNEV